MSVDSAPKKSLKPELVVIAALALMAAIGTKSLISGPAKIMKDPATLCGDFDRPCSEETAVFRGLMHAGGIALCYFIPMVLLVKYRDQKVDESVRLGKNVVLASAVASAFYCFPLVMPLVIVGVAAVVGTSAGIAYGQRLRQERGTRAAST